MYLLKVFPSGKYFFAPRRILEFCLITRHPSLVLVFRHLALEARLWSLTPLDLASLVNSSLISAVYNELQKSASLIGLHIHPHCLLRNKGCPDTATQGDGGEFALNRIYQSQYSYIN